MQQGRLDLITENASANVRRVQARDLGASVVQALFRLTKQAMVHSIDNQAVVRQVEDAVHVLNDYAERTDLNVSILFSYGSIFVGGQLLKASRQTYDGASELGDFLKKFGYSELAIQKGVTAQDLFSFVSAINEANRNGRAQALEKPSARVRMRAVGEAALKRGATVERLDENQAVVRAYASAIVIMRRFFEQLKKGRYDLPQRVKRIAQSLVDLSAGETPAFLGVTAARNANHDEAGKAVNATILAVSVARQITDDIVGLVRLAMAALLYDIAKPRLTGTVGPTPPVIMPRLSDAQELELPAATAAVLTALGRVNEPSVMRTVTVYEAHWYTRQRELGPLYRGLRPATLQARIVSITRRFNDLLTPAPGADPLPADEALGKLESEAVDQTDHMVLRLLVGALGIFPTGTLLQLGTGEMGLVVSTPAHPSHYSMPRMRLHYDANGGRLPQPVDVDLATLQANDPRKQVVRVVAPADDNSRQQARMARGGPQAQPQQGQAQPGFGAQPSFGQQPAQQPAAQVSRPPGFTPQHTPTNVGSAPSQQSNPFTPTGSNPQSPGRAPARTPPPEQLRAQNRTPPPAQQQVRQPTPAPLQPGDPGWDEQAAYEAEQRAYQQRMVEYQKQLDEYNRQLAAYNAQQQPQAAQDMTELDSSDLQAEPSHDEGAATRAVAWGDQANLMAAMNQGQPQPIALAPDPGPPRRNTGEQQAAAPRRNTGEQALPRRNTGEIAAPRRNTGEQPAPVMPPVAARASGTHAAAAPQPKSEQQAPAGTPTAEGNLTKTPLVHLLVYMLDQRLTGTTEFHTPEGPVHAVYFDKGVPSKVKTGAMVYPLDRVLLELGVLDEIKLRDSLMEMSKKNVLHGRLLVSKGLVDGPTILKALKFQLIRKLTYLFEMAPATRYAFYADVNMLESYGGPELIPCEPLALIMTGVRMRGEDQLIDQTLARLKARPLGLHIDSDVKRFEFQKEESRIADVLRVKRMSLDEILNSGVGHERIIRLTLYALAITRHLDIGAQGRAPIGIAPKGGAQAVSGVIERGGAQPVAAVAAAAAAPAPQAAPAPARETPAPGQQQGLGIDFGRMGTPAPSPQPAAAAYAPPQPAYAPPQQAYAPPPAQPAYAAPQAAYEPPQPAYEPPPQPQPYAPPPPAYAPAPQQAYAPPQQAYAQAQQTYAQGQAGYPPPAQYGAQANYGGYPQAPQQGYGGYPSAPAYGPPVAPAPPPARPAPAPPAPPPVEPAPAAKVEPKLSDELALRKQEIIAKSERIDDEDYFAMLGLDPKATAGEIQAAYFKVAKTWHPDRLPVELADVKGLVSKVFAKFNEANATLSDAQKRSDYIKNLDAGGGNKEEEEQVRRVVDAAFEFQKAEIYLKKNDIVNAEASAKSAASADPDQVEYLALLLWIQAVKRGDGPAVPEGKTSSFFDDLISQLDTVIKKSPSLERALFYRATLLKRSGRDEKALRDFRQVATLNPKNIDALRELRLYQMRKEKKGAGDGIMGKLFKK